MNDDQIKTAMDEVQRNLEGVGSRFPRPPVALHQPEADKTLPQWLGLIGGMLERIERRLEHVERYLGLE